MKLSKKLKKTDINIEDLYAVKLRSIWAAARQEHVAFWSLTVYFFFEYVRPQSIYPVIDIFPWAQLALIMSLFGAVTDKSVTWTKNVENKIFISFVLIIILSAIFAFKPSISWSYHTIILNWILVYFLTITIINSEKRLLLFLFAYMLFNFKMSQHGFFSWANRGFSFASWGLIGAAGWFQNSGEYSIQMLIFGCLSTAFVTSLREKWGRYKKWFFYFVPFTAFMTVIGASSRGSQLALAVVGLMYLIKSKMGFKAILGLAVAFMLLFNFLPEEQMKRIESSGNDSTSLKRIAYWKYGMKIMNEYPVLGVGYENWRSFIIFRAPEELGESREEPHNIFIKAGVELGYVGLLCFILMIIYVFVVNARTRKKAKQLGHDFYLYISYGLDAGLLGYLVAGFFVTVLYYPFFWVQMAMSVALNNIMNKKYLEKCMPSK